MKIMRFLLSMMIAALFLRAASLASESGAAPQPAPSQNGEKSASDRPSAVQGGLEKDGGVRGGEGQTSSGKAAGDQQPLAGPARNTIKRPASVSHSKPVPSPRIHPAKTSIVNSNRTAAPENVSELQQTTSNVGPSLSNKVVNRRNPASPAPPSAVSVNGQQFKNSRDPGAHLAVSGGPLTAGRGTAAINGTNMKRRP